MNTFGEKIKLTVFGKSHAECIGAVIEGLPSGTKIDEEYVGKIMALRAPGNSPFATKRKEPDKVEFESGVKDGFSTGEAIRAVIYNTNTRSSDYSELVNRPRPSHADYPATVRYGEGYDIRGGGQFSGRMTAPICIAGGIVLPLLEESGIRVSAHILSVGNIKDKAFSLTEDENGLMESLSEASFPVIDEDAGEKMKELIIKASQELDSVGGVIECKITGLPVGLGEPMFCGIENAVAKAMFGIPAVKGIEFGSGFEGVKLFGSQYNDSYYYDENGKVRTRTNNAGGICGGMATGMPVVFRIAVKPTPSIARKQETVDLLKKENTFIEIKGRHDPCILSRAAVVVRAVAAFAVYDLMKYLEEDCED